MKLPECPQCQTDEGVKRLAVVDKTPSGTPRVTPLVGVFFHYHGNDSNSVFYARDPEE